MTNSELEKAYRTVQPAVREAGMMVKGIRKRGDFSVRTKPDDSPVTSADEQANEFLTLAIKSHFPDHVVIGEEDHDKYYPAGTEYIWYIDPIDGTRSYINGSSHYYVLAGLVHKGIPVLGLHYRPEKDEMITGWTGNPPLLLNGKKTSKPLEYSSSFDEKSKVYMKTGNEHIRDALRAKGLSKAGYAPGMVDMIAPLFGLSDGFISYRSTAYWDLAAPAAIMNAAGFRHAGSPGGLHIPVLFNDGSIRTHFYYNLPPDTPDSLISDVAAIRKAFEGRE
jgi:3'(2'), 5'-bisphosphate nucleotidase